MDITPLLKRTHWWYLRFSGDDDGESEHDDGEDSDDNEEGGVESQEISEKNPPDGKVLVKLRHVYGQDPGLFEEFSRWLLLGPFFYPSLM